MSERRRTIRVDALPRVEGEGSLFLRLRGERVTEARLALFEPPRLFEALLRGRAYLEAPDVTSRICGICPAAYLMSGGSGYVNGEVVTIDGGEWLSGGEFNVVTTFPPEQIDGMFGALRQAGREGRKKK